MKKLVCSGNPFNDFGSTSIGMYFKEKKISSVNSRNFVYLSNVFDQAVYYPFSLLKLNIYKAIEGKYTADNCKNIITTSVKPNYYNKKCETKNISDAFIVVGTKKNPLFIYNNKNNNVYINEAAINANNIIEVVTKAAHLAINIATLLKMTRIKNYLVDFISNIPEITRVKHKVNVGIDGELELVKEGEVVKASRHYSGTSSSDKIGVDGSGDPMEIRPDYGTPDKLVNSVESIIQSINDHISVQGDKYPIGCHIHFSVDNNKFDNGYDFSQVAKCLDFYLGRRCLPMNGRRRGPESSYGYGRLSDIRAQFHGGFEYRVLPSSILGSKELFTLIVSIGKKVVEDFVNGENLMVDFSGMAELEDYVALGIAEEDAQRFIDLVDYSTLHKDRLWDVRAAWGEEIRISKSTE